MFLFKMNIRIIETKLFSIVYRYGDIYLLPAVMFPSPVKIFRIKLGTECPVSHLFI